MDMRKKLVMLFVMVLLAFVVLGVRLVLINTQKGDEYTHTVLSQRHYDSMIIPYQRGSIVDSNGTTLAVSKKVYNVVLDVSVMNYYENRTAGTTTATISALQKCFGVNSHEISAYAAENPNSKYYVLAKRLDYEEIQPFLAMVEEAKASEELTDLQGVWFEEEYLRYYPLGTVACDVLGYTNAGNAGAYGLEEYYNDTLNGTNGREYGYLNEDSNLERTTIPAVNGNTLVTTIDANIQKIVEEKLTEYNEAYFGNYRENEDGSYNTGCIIMEVDTGNILAMAGYPFYDLNEPRNAELYFTPEEIAAVEESGGTVGEMLAELWKNYCISATYEPGSVAKPFTVAAAIDSGSITGNETYYCGGLLEIGGYKIRCHNRYGDGEINVSNAVAQSCNVALMHIADATGKHTYLKYFEEFNFGLKTNIDLTGEARTISLVFNENTMGPTELATSSFGQGYNVTMIQMITAFCSLVNGGYYYEPHMVSQVLSADGAVIENIEPRLLKQTISGTTSEKIIEYCNEVVISGTGKKARPAGYAIGGKTGTAETVVNGVRSKEDYVVSFMGYAPADDPQIAIYVVIDRPNMPDQTGGTAEACLITKEILTEVLPYLNIYMTEELSEEEIADLEARGLYNANLVKPDEETSEEGEDGEEGAEGEEGTEGETSEEPQKPEVQIDPETGYAIDPYTGEFLDPETGRPINPGSGLIQGGPEESEEPEE
ncbi:MAG: cell division protein FtsI [Lachnospiraceae bacterium]|nr:cell division protein FtsI [Lachnospiraceae bacterium]